MHICLEISAALSQDAGIGRYARELALALHELPDGPQLTLFHNHQPMHRMPAALATLPRIEVPFGNRAWRAFILTGVTLSAPYRTSIEHADLFHGTDSLAPYLKTPTVITIHDLSTTLFPQHHTRMHRLFARLSLPRMARRASAIIADSESTRQDVITHLHIAPSRVHAIHLAVNHSQFYPRDPIEARSKIAQALNITTPYILAVGTLEPRKNLITLLEAYGQLSTDAPMLVLAGARGWVDSPLFAAVQRLGLTQRVHFTGHVADELLPSLYSAAQVFVYPSLYEGFGLPVLEALACGTPVITSNTSSLPEVAGDAATLVDPHNPDQLAEQLQHILSNQNKRTELSVRGPARALQFTWQRTAQLTMDVYRQVLAQ
jgi:glycosyltransferase involved in cell wall biosynthesis